MSRITPRPFQENAIASGLAVFGECRRLLEAAGIDAAGCAVARGHHGTLLIEAPTGAGKTLVAGHLVERFSEVERIVWFWFAPFKGVVGQTAASLRAELPGLRLRELANDRQGDDSRAGDVFVTTWQTVATKVKDRRNVHKRSEQNLTVEELVTALREQGLRVGVVVDEAHHGFSGAGAETQALKFFREVLRPEYTVLVTATPDDADVARFQTALGLARINRIVISRHEPVDEGLIKPGIKCVAYFAAEAQKSLVDFETTALRDGAAMHHRVKAELKKLGVALVPLLLVQVDSREKSVERTKERLLKEGFTEEQIAVHTAEEPDSGLLALANDESREVLIFKMAVALGFDAPRAFGLVSMRAARDEDFGVQLVGRILRVHRKLQGRARAGSLPEALRYGCVFLADAESQTGLDLAGQRINRVRTEYAKISPTTAIVHVGDQQQVQVLGLDGQSQFFALTEEDAPGMVGEESAGDSSTPRSMSGTVIDLLTGDFSRPPTSTDGTAAAGGAATIVRKDGRYLYRLRADAPRHFKTQVVSPDNEATEEDCAQRFIVETADVVRALAAKVKVEKKTLEVFTSQLEIEFTQAAMDPGQAARLALKALTRNEAFDARELRQALLRKLSGTLREMGLDQAQDPEKVGHMLNVILACHPELLHHAQKAALAAHFVVEPAEEPIPEEWASEEPLPASRHNLYRIVPADLNEWERDFAQLLDGDSLGVVRWWHRNPPLKPWSVQVVLADGRGFFPDFVVGIEGRETEEGALLTDPKYGFEVAAELPKAHATHPSYGRVLILNRQGGGHWMTVRYEEKQDRAVLGSEFRLADAAGY